MKCSRCTLPDTVKHPCLMGRGCRINARVMFIQDVPDEDDDAAGKVLAGSSGKTLETLLVHRGIDSSKVYITSMIKCAVPDPSKFNLQSCNSYLEDEVDTVNPDIIVPMGNLALKYCVGTVGLTKIRGNAQEVELAGRTRIILPMMNPKMAEVKPMYKEYIRKDLDTLQDLYNNGMTQVTGTDYRYLETTQDIAAEIARLKSEANELVFDIETTGKSPYMHYSKIVCISLTDKSHYGVVIPLYKHDNPMNSAEIGYTVKLLRCLLEDDSIPKCAHNGKFDVEWLKEWLNISVANFSFDTMLAHYLCITEERGTQGLKSQAWEFTDMGGYDNQLDEYVKTLSDGEGAMSRYNYDRVPWDILKTYAAADADCCFRLMQLYQAKIYRNPKWAVVMDEVMMPGSYALEEVEANGMKIDMATAQRYAESYAAEIRAIKAQLEAFPEVLELEREKREMYKEREKLMSIPRKDRTPEEQKRVDFLKRYQDFKFNFSSVAQLKELLYDKMGLVTTVKTDKGEPSTNEDAMKELAEQGVQIPHLLLELRKVNTLNNMFIQKLPTLRDSKDIIHSSFNMAGTVTGRLSSEMPNFQQIPRKTENPLLFQYHNEPKALFVSRFGSDGCIMNADYCLAPDTMIQLINGEQDNIKSICERVTAGEQVYTYSINPKTEEIVVSRIVAGRMTRVNEPTLRVTLDNDESVVCSYNHKFLLRSGEYKEAQHLSDFEVLMGFAATPGVHTSKVLVTKVEPQERMDLYDIEVENNHNFPLAAGIFISNSALEMRIAAVISEDPLMEKALLSGADIHKANASYIFNVPIEEVSKEQRTAAKSV